MTRTITDEASALMEDYPTKMRMQDIAYMHAVCDAHPEFECKRPKRPAPKTHIPLTELLLLQFAPNATAQFVISKIEETMGLPHGTHRTKNRSPFYTKLKKAIVWHLYYGNKMHRNAIARLLGVDGTTVTYYFKLLDVCHGGECDGHACHRD